MFKILVVDDDHQSINFIKDILKSLGYFFEFLLDLDLLFKRLEVKKFDLILLDAKISNGRGLEQLNKIRSHIEYCHIPIIMMTSNSDEAILVDCLENGAADFVTKPLSSLTLKARIRSTLLEQQVKTNLEELVKARTAELNESLNVQKKISEDLSLKTCQLKKLNEKLIGYYDSLEQLTKTFQLFVPKPYLDRILSDTFSPGTLEKHQFSILFSDIRSYTNYSEQMNPEEVFEFLNTFFSLT